MSDATRTLADLPQPQGAIFGGLAAKWARNALGLVTRSFADHGEMVHLPMGRDSFVLVSNPDAVQRVLIDNQRAYSKAVVNYQALKPILGEGLLTGDGEHWLRQRRIAQPAFHRERIQSFAPEVIRCTEEMMAAWQPAIDAGEPIDMHVEMTRLTLRIIGLTMLSVDLAEESSELGDAATLCLEHANTLVAPTGQGGSEHDPDFLAARGLLDDAIAAIIAERQALIAEGKDPPHDLLTLLLEARDPETGEGMSAEELRDETMTIFMAGHETTANAMTWILRCLSDNDQVRARYREQLDAEGGAIDLDAIDRAPYGKQIVLESLRLYPTAWLIARHVEQDDVLDGVALPAGCKVFICLYVMHRHPDHWTDPETFDPDRFEGDPKLPRGLFLPFGAGPRQCIGGGYAMMSTQLMLGHMVQRFDMNLRPGFRPDVDAGITLRPYRGMPMIVTPRPT
jgi:cytochrome P450